MGAGGVSGAGEGGGVVGSGAGGGGGVVGAGGGIVGVGVGVGGGSAGFVERAGGGVVGSTGAGCVGGVGSSAVNAAVAPKVRLANTTTAVAASVRIRGLLTLLPVCRICSCVDQHTVRAREWSNLFIARIRRRFCCGRVLSTTAVPGPSAVLCPTSAGDSFDRPQLLTLGGCAPPPTPPPVAPPS
jgi:hypothetical protein